VNRVIFVSGWAGFPALFPGLGGDFYLPFAPHGEEDIALAVARAARAGQSARSGRSEQSGQSGRSGRSGNEAILIGWSTGAHILLKRCQEFFPRFATVLLLAPFTCFTDHVPASEIQALAANLARSPAAALRGFYRRCGVTGNVSGAHAAPSPEALAASVPGLLAGLDYLAGSKALVADLPGNVVLAHGADDRIVPLAASRELAASGRARLAVVPGGHYFQPELVHELLA